jgi:surface polysaccharide O-acyltransferase-like enzyme
MNKGKRLWPYLVAAAVCLIIANVYALYGHGVRSDAMDYMFLYPLIGGLVIKVLSMLLHGDYSRGVKRVGVNLYNSGLAALACGALLRGIVEIAGTDSVYISWFFVAGWVMAAFGAIAILSQKTHR